MHSAESETFIFAAIATAVVIAVVGTILMTLIRSKRVQMLVMGSSLVPFFIGLTGTLVAWISRNSSGFPILSATDQKDWHAVLVSSSAAGAIATGGLAILLGGIFLLRRPRHVVSSGVSGSKLS